MNTNYRRQLRDLSVQTSDFPTSTNQTLVNLTDTFNITFDPSVNPLLTDETQFKTYFEALKAQTTRTTDFIAKMINSTSKLINYTNSDLQIYIVLVNNTFNFKDFFANNIRNYQPWVDMKDCINYLMTTRYKKVKYELSMSFVY